MGMSGESSRRFDIVAQTRRVRSDEEKRAIIAEASQGYRNTSAVARRHGIKPSLLFRWKRQFAADPVPGHRPTPTASFVPVLSLPSPETKMAARVHPGVTHQSQIEIEVSGGRKVRVSSDIDAGVLMRIITALETLS